MKLVTVFRRGVAAIENANCADSMAELVRLESATDPKRDLM
jgi:hypothetical protein